VLALGVESHPVSIVLAALAECAEWQAHAATIESLMSGETVASWAVCEPGRGWAPPLNELSRFTVTSKGT